MTRLENVDFKLEKKISKIISRSMIDELSSRTFLPKDCTGIRLTFLLYRAISDKKPAFMGKLVDRLAIESRSNPRFDIDEVEECEICMSDQHKIMDHELWMHLLSVSYQSFNSTHSNFIKYKVAQLPAHNFELLRAAFTHFFKACGTVEATLDSIWSEARGGRLLECCQKISKFDMTIRETVNIDNRQGLVLMMLAIPSLKANLENVANICSSDNAKDEGDKELMMTLLRYIQKNQYLRLGFKLITIKDENEFESFRSFCARASLLLRQFSCFKAVLKVSQGRVFTEPLLHWAIKSGSTGLVDKLLRYYPKAQTESELEDNDGFDIVTLAVFTRNALLLNYVLKRFSLKSPKNEQTGNASAEYSKAFGLKGMA